MAPRLTDEERQRIIGKLREGKSARSIADEMGRSQQTVSLIAAEIGHTFGQVNTARAEATAAYGRERRAEVAKLALERAAEVLERMSGPHTAFNFGGKENTYAEVTLPAPDSRALADYARAAASLAKIVLDVDRHDNRDDLGLSAVDAWLAEVTGQ